MTQTNSDDWRDRARCSGVKTDTARLFHSDDIDDQRAALMICQACPVRPDCLEHALNAREQFGIWGGRTEGQRRRIRKDRRRLNGHSASRPGSGDTRATLAA